MTFSNHPVLSLAIWASLQKVQGTDWVPGTTTVLTAISCVKCYLENMSHHLKDGENKKWGLEKKRTETPEQGYTAVQFVQ